MKQEITYSFERDDSVMLSLPRIEEIFRALQSYATEEEQDREDPAAGVKAFRRIRGNVFTASDIETYRDFAFELIGRGRRFMDTLREERDRIAKGDADSERAYNAMIEATESALDRTQRQIDEFIDAFEEEFPGQLHCGRKPAPAPA